MGKLNSIFEFFVNSKNQRIGGSLLISKMELVFSLIFLVFGAFSMESQDNGILHDRARLREIADEDQNDFVFAVWADHLDVVKSLAEKVDLNRADKIGCTPVHVAAFKGHKEIVKFLVNKVDLNRVDDYGLQQGKVTQKLSNFLRWRQAAGSALARLRPAQLHARRKSI